MTEGTETKPAGYVAAMLAPALAMHPGETCSVLLEDNRLAFLARLAMVDRASASIDVQYYIIRGDLTGLLLVQRLIAAADRGVRVRVLIDDAHTAGQDALIAAFDKHPNVVVRLFNPFPGARRWNIFRLFGALFGGGHLLRRMHNKALIVDDAVAIIGGRNLGDEYFDAGKDLAFHDLDVAAFGPVVPGIRASFEVFWDSPASHPARDVAGRSTTRLATIRARLAEHSRNALGSDYGAVLRSTDLLDKLEGPELEPYWGRAEVVFDDPTKVDAPQPERRWRRWRKRVRPVRMMPRLMEAIESVRDHLTLISPYFVPGERGCEFLEALVARGVTIRVLTNSLAATDVPAVHAGYERYRKRLLRAGVVIHEMRRDPLEPRGRLMGSSPASLHAKAFSVDGRLAMVGSMNLDPRSAFLNTELGLLVESPALAERIELYYRERSDARRSYRVTLHRRGSTQRVRWDWIDADGTAREAWREPDASVWRRATAQVISWLPLEAHL